MQIDRSSPERCRPIVCLKAHQALWVMVDMKHTSYIALAALLMCGACTGNQRMAEAEPAVTAKQEVATVRWDEVTAANNLLKPNNTFLIMMR